jgi:hypothetical protein
MLKELDGEKIDSRWKKIDQMTLAKRTQMTLAKRTHNKC